MTFKRRVASRAKPWGRAASVGFVCAVILCVAGIARAQSPAAGDDTRSGRLTAQQQEKSTRLKPYAPRKAEEWVKTLEEQLITGAVHWHPFFQSAYAGGGFTLGAGYLSHVGSYNTLDLRGSYTPSGYIRMEAEYRAPRLFDRRGTLSLLTGWREATQVAFYGVGTTIRPRRTRRTTASGSRLSQPLSTSGRRGTGCCSRAVSSTHNGSSAPGKALCLRSRRSTRLPHCRA